MEGTATRGGTAASPRNRRRAGLCRVALVGVLLMATLSAQHPGDVNLSAIQRIKAEAFQRSEVMEHAFWITDVHGPRLTNSPGHRQAAAWIAKRLESFGLSLVALEPAEFHGRSWQTTHYEGHLIAPSYTPIIGQPLAYTRGTDGPVQGTPVHAVLESEADLETWRGRLRGRIVLIEPMKAQPLLSAPLSHRWTDAELAEEAMAPPPGVVPCREFRLGAGGGPCPAFPPAEAARRREFRQRVQAFLAQEGAAVILVQGTGNSTGGTVFGMSGGSPNPSTPEAPCTIALTPEHYNRIVRLLDRQVPVTVAFNVKAEILEPAASFNVVGELPGGRLRDEVVLVGAHLDSWAIGTGATDNAAGTAIAIEAMRILAASRLPLDRTVRIALWASEELALFGSRAYVRRHFADPATMKPSPEHDRFSAYFNIDQGGGRIRGVYLQGNEAARPSIARWLTPWHDLGATIVTSRDQSSDNKAFEEVGLPNFSFLQDDLEYGTRTWHSNMDVYDRLQPGDMMQAAAVVASFLYHAANAAERLPRKPLPPAAPSAFPPFLPAGPAGTER